MKSRKSLGTIGVRTGSNSTMIGYLFLPPNVDRDLYIKDVFKTQSLIMVDEKGGYWENVFVSKSLLSDLAFPENTKSRGCVLVCNKVPKSNVPVVVAVLDLKEISGILEEENQFRLLKVSKDKNNTVDIDGRAERGTLNINISAKETKTGKFNINVTNTDKTAELNLYVKGMINLLADKDFNVRALRSFNQIIVDDQATVLAYLSYIKGVGLEIKDEWGNKIIMTKDETAIVSSTGKKVSVDDIGGVLIDATSAGNVEIKSGSSVIEISEQGVTIDVGDKELFLNGEFPILYAKSNAAEEILDVSEIGVSKSVKVGT